MMRAPALLLAMALPFIALPASAQATSTAQAPQVGECYDLSDARLEPGADAYWPDPEAVACSQPHTFEVTETGPLPQDVNAFAFAASQCGALDVWNAVGVNRASAGVVADPLRIEARSFAVRETLPAYVCGGVAVRLNGRLAPTPVALTSRIERLGHAGRAALRYCSAAPSERPVTVPCSSRPRWQVSSWVMWTAFYDAYPGRAALRERAGALCGDDLVVGIPSGAQWDEGPPRTWCYREYP